MEQLQNLSREIRSIREALPDSDDLECELSYSTDYKEMVFSGSRAALLHVAVRMVELAAKDLSGAHFTIDRADIAIDSDQSLTIALKKSSE